MHQLEYQLLDLSIEVETAVKKDGRPLDPVIIAAMLRQLATQSHDYIPDPDLLWNEDGTRDYEGEEKRGLG